MESLNIISSIISIIASICAIIGISGLINFKAANKHIIISKIGNITETIIQCIEEYDKSCAISFGSKRTLKIKNQLKSLIFLCNSLIPYTKCNKRRKINYFVKWINTLLYDMEDSLEIDNMDLIKILNRNDVLNNLKEFLKTIKYN